MLRRIESFTQDAAADWCALLSCGHPQHVRHDPPLISRPWVLTAEGRSSRVGVELDCLRCDRWVVVFETPRLLLRRLEEEDVPNLVTLDADPDVVRFVDLREPTTPERAAVWMRTMRATYYPQPSSAAPHRFGFWAVVERQGGRFLGWYHLKPVDGDDRAGEIGYRLRRDAWGHGYASELSLAMVTHAFTRLGLTRILARALCANVASTRVMEKAGLRPTRRYEHAGTPAIEYALDAPPPDAVR